MPPGECIEGEFSVGDCSGPDIWPRPIMPRNPGCVDDGA